MKNLFALTLLCLSFQPHSATAQLPQEDARYAFLVPTLVANANFPVDEKHVKTVLLAPLRDVLRQKCYITFPNHSKLKLKGNVLTSAILYQPLDRSDRNDAVVRMEWNGTRYITDTYDKTMDGIEKVLVRLVSEHVPSRCPAR
jgi:hypothetical protein